MLCIFRMNYHLHFRRNGNGTYRSQAVRPGIGFSQMIRKRLPDAIAQAGGTRAVAFVFQDPIAGSDRSRLKKMLDQVLQDQNLLLCELRDIQRCRSLNAK